MPLRRFSPDPRRRGPTAWARSCCSLRQSSFSRPSLSSLGGYAPARSVSSSGMPTTPVFPHCSCPGAPRRRSSARCRCRFLLVALAFLANAGLGAYHAGVEWKLWAGPSTCCTAQGLSTSAGGLLENIEKTRVVRCDEAAWRFLGLSFAGWNVLISLALAAGAVTAAIEGLRRPG